MLDWMLLELIDSRAAYAYEACFFASCVKVSFLLMRAFS